MNLINRIVTFSLMVTMAGFLAKPAMADISDMSAIQSMVESMQKNMAEMQKTIDRQNDKIFQLERNQTSGSMGAPVSTGEMAAGPMTEVEFKERLGTALGGADKWLKNLNFKGDLRLRYEAFQNTSGATTEDDDRNRFRYRLRFGFDKKFNDDLNAGFSLASGEGPRTSATSTANAVNVDPTSTNTSFDDNFSFKPVYIEKAYASYSPSFLENSIVKDIKLIGGKMDNAFEKGSSDIIWDRDVKPEGLIEKFDFKLYESEDVQLGAFFTAGQFILDEDGTSSAGAGDAELYAFQAGINPILYVPGLERPLDLTSAVSFYSYNDYATNGNFTIGGTSLARNNPNTLGAATDLDTQDFEIFEVYNEIAVNVLGTPVRPFFDWAENLNSELSDSSGLAGIATGEQSAIAFGVKLGAIVDKGDWELSWAHKQIDANAVPGFNDSDFGYAGHSGKRGEVFKGSYAITKNMNVNLAAFFVENLNSGTGGIIDEQQRRFQTDLVWKF